MAAQTNTKADSAGITEDIQSLEILGFREKIRKVKSTFPNNLAPANIGSKCFRVLLQGTYLNGEIRVTYKDGDVEVQSKVQWPYYGYEKDWPSPEVEHVHSLRVGYCGIFLITAEKLGRFSCLSVSENSIKVRCSEVGEVLPIRVTLRFHPKSLSKIHDASICRSVAAGKEIPYVKKIAEKNMSDVAIICSDQEFKAHQIILKCVSPVFERMLAAGMTETTTGRIVIEDLDVETVRTMLNYIYTGEFRPTSDQSLVCLTYCAEKYALIDLKRLCFEEMASRLSIENATSFVAVALKCGTEIENMKTKIVGFCKTNFAELSALPEFQDFIRGNLEMFL